MSAYHEPVTEVTAPTPIDCAFERMELSEQQLRDLAFAELLEFHGLRPGSR